MKTIEHHLSEEGTSFGPGDVLLLCPDFSLSPKHSATAKRAREILSNAKLGSIPSAHDAAQCGLSLAHTIAAAEAEIEKAARAIAGTRYAVAIHIRRTGGNLILCELWRD